MRRPVAGLGDGDSFSDWYKGLPLVTKVLTTSAVLTAAMASFGIINEMHFAFLFPLIVKKFHFWRLIAPFLYAGPFSFPFAMHTFILYENCKRYEENPFNTGGGGNSSDFLFMILFGMALLIILAYFFDLFNMSEPLLYMFMYVWSRKNPETISNIFGFKFKAIYLPWAYIVIRVLMGGQPTMPLMGIAVGHIYYFIINVLPDSHGYDLLRTPNFCVDIVRWYTGISGVAAPGVGRAPAADPNAANAPGRFPSMGAGHNWGRGRALGTS